MKEQDTENQIESAFGLCPICKGQPEIANVGRIYWAVCREHLTSWEVSTVVHRFKSQNLPLPKIEPADAEWRYKLLNEHPYYPLRTDAYGLCPTCRSQPKILNLQNAHFGVCHDHRVYWYIGDDIFPDWTHENYGIWGDNWELFQTYQRVEPSYNPGRIFNGARWRAEAEAKVALAGVPAVVPGGEEDDSWCPS